MRTTRNEAWSTFRHVLTNAIAAVKGEIACLDTATGLLTVGATSATLKPIGYFDEDLAGDGTLRVNVRLFKETRIHWFDNDVATAVVAADIGSDAYVLDGETVTGDATGASVAGQVWAVNTLNGVAVEMVGF